MQSDSVYKLNLKALKNLNPYLCRELEDRKGENGSVRIIDTETGSPTMEVFSGNKRLMVHSKKDPLGEARRFARSDINGSEQTITGTATCSSIWRSTSRLGWVFMTTASGWCCSI